MATLEEYHDQNYIENNGPRQILSASPNDLLETTLETLLAAHPPQQKYNEELQKGVFSGYTSLAYLLLQISRLYPEMSIDGLTLLQHSARYLEPISDQPALREINGGLHCERLSVHVLRACISKSSEDIQKVLDDAPLFLSDEYPDELFYGRAGVLHLLRLVKASVPEAGSRVDETITAIVEKTLQSRSVSSSGYGGWTFLGRRYLGPAHGDIGIILQVVRSKPSAAAELQNLLKEIIDMQSEDGNWPKSPHVETEKQKDLVQWCHGAPGMVMSLRALEPFYPELKGNIERAIARGTALTWKKGLSRKEPSMCHGILGNSLYASTSPYHSYSFIPGGEPNLPCQLPVVCFHLVNKGHIFSHFLKRMRSQLLKQMTPEFSSRPVIRQRYHRS